MLASFVVPLCVVTVVCPRHGLARLGRTLGHAFVGRLALVVLCHRYRCTAAPLDLAPLLGWSRTVPPLPRRRVVAWSVAAPASLARHRLG
jgi:hypothetical protein